MKKLFKKNSGEEHNFWMSYTDLMSGFLVVFIILSAILYKHFNELYTHYETQTHLATIAEEKYNEALEKLKRSKNDTDSLRYELLSLQTVVDSLKRNDLKNLIRQYNDVFVYDTNVKVDIDTSKGSIILTNRNANEDLFNKGEAIMRKELREYIDKIGKKMVERTMLLWRYNGYKDVELRIEGHTDPTWGYYERGGNYSFIKNLTLSSERANNVFEYILENTGLNQEQQEFVKRNMISIGYSFSSRASHNSIANKSEDASSRRIEFRIISR